MNGERTPVLTGGCQCGAVRYAFYAQPTNIGACYCRMCQKAVGGPFEVLATVQLADFAWTRGKPANYRSSSLAERHFCANCGTPLSLHNIDDPEIEITVGSLDEPEKAAPDHLYGIESRLSWLDTLDGLTAKRADTDMAARGEVANSYQHPDHETGNDWRPPKPAEETP